MSRCRLVWITFLLIALVGAPVGATVAEGQASSPGATDVTADAPSPSSDVSTGPRITAAYPNPVASGDTTEFVVITVPPNTRLGNYTLTDGARSAALPNETVSGPVAITDAPRRVSNLTSVDVVAVESGLQLANGGKRIELHRNDSRVDSVRYGDAPEGSMVRWSSNGGHPKWQPLGATDRPVVRGGPDEVRSFVLPDAGDEVASALRSAERRVLVAGYTLSSTKVVDALVNAADRGATVRVLLDGGPVDGITRQQAAALDDLAAAGIDVRLLDGPHERYAFHHPKYAVVDDRALVLTENFKPSGTGGASSRGWGVVTDQPRIVENLTATFRADAEWRAAEPWSTFRQGRSFDPGGRANGSYPRHFEPSSVSADSIELLVAPDNAESQLVGHIDDADESLRIVQMSVDERDGPFLQAALRAARRGVDVQLLLSSAWYVQEENQQLADELNAMADEQDLSLTAKLADPRGRYEKIHAKGVVIDDRHVVLGSLNWNTESARENREVVLVLSGDEVAEYYGQVFDADWGDGGGGRGLPVGLIAAAIGCVVLAGLVVRRFEFER